MILRFGGSFFARDNNVANRNAFEYILGLANPPIFALGPFPGVFSKAATYAFYIIRDHVFHDGNKRTGIEAALLFLEKNGIVIPRDIDPEEIINLALSVEDGSAKIENIALWLKTIIGHEEWT